MIKIITITVIFLFSGLLAMGQNTEESRKRTNKHSADEVVPVKENKEKFTSESTRTDKSNQEILDEYRQRIDKVKENPEKYDEELVRKMEKRYEELKSKLDNK